MIALQKSAWFFGTITAIAATVVLYPLFRATSAIRSVVIRTSSGRRISNLFEDIHPTRRRLQFYRAHKDSFGKPMKSCKTGAPSKLTYKKIAYSTFGINIQRTSIWELNGTVALQPVDCSN